MWGLACLTVLISIVVNARKVDHGGRLGLEIHPNRHRHHQHDVFLAGFFPTTLGYHETSIGQGVMPAVKLALHDVNRSPDILKNHHLRMHWNNTAVSSPISINQFSNLLGGACFLPDFNPVLATWLDTRHKRREENGSERKLCDTTINRNIPVY